MKKCVVLISALLLILSVALVLTACNSSPTLNEGYVATKEFGNPIFESKGIFDLRIAGSPAYFIKIVYEDDFQWFRFTDADAYNRIRVGDWFVYDSEICKPVSSFLDRS